MSARVRARVAICATLVPLALPLALFGGRARAQTLDGAATGDAPPPGIPALYCAGCEKPERVRVLPRLSLPLTFGGALVRVRDDAQPARPARTEPGLAIGARPELTIGRVGDRVQLPWRVHVGLYGEALATAFAARRTLVGGGATVALTTGAITGLALSVGAFGASGARLDGAWHAGGTASLFVGAWMPDAAIALVPSLGVRVDARFAGSGERSIAVSVQIDPVMVGLLLVGLAG